MTMQQPPPASAYHLVWVYPVPLATVLDSATWLQTTQALRRLGWQVTLVGKGPTGEHLINGVQVTCIATVEKYLLNTLVFHLRVLLFLWRHWRTTDVVFFHQLSAPWLLPLRLLRPLLGGPSPQLVMDTRDLNVVDGSLKNRLRRTYFEMTHRLANLWADGQTAITPRMAELVKIPRARRWGYWPSGVSLDRFADLHCGREWPAPNQAVELIYVGKLHSERNLLPLCTAVEQANRQGMNFRLTFVGSGPEQAKLEAAAATSAGRIRLLPAVSHERIPDLLRSTHCGVTSLPAPGDRKVEASNPIKLFEYMAAGLPLLATSNACHTDVVDGGRYAFWAHGVDPESLLRALASIEAAKGNLSELGEEARKSVHRWSWSAAGEQLDKALKLGLLHASYT
ncbi:MAG TPA: glycosyltransferase [Caldilineaceae bacterium]|nr:glycosyltransferase [Caldilineaceae bacterium]